MSAVSGPDVATVKQLLDTRLEPGQVIVSSIAAAHREARNLVGRDPATGDIVAPEHGQTWAGALVYLIFCEQIGSCFSLEGEPRMKSHDLQSALMQFADFEPHDALDLTRLRNRLAHDYTLIEPARGSRPGEAFALHGSAHEPVVRRMSAGILIGLPALAIRIERTFCPAIDSALAGHRLVCHHPGGVAGVVRRSQMGVING